MQRTSSATQGFRRLIDTGKLTPASCRAQIAAHNPHINAFVRTSPAPSSSSSSPTKPLAHHSVAVKDSICTRDMGTGCASAMLRDFKPPYDATVVRLLRAAGADIIGKTNCDEFGMGSLNTHTIHGPVINPRSTAAYLRPPPSASPPPDLRARSAGGSSGGSAAAVAAGMCFAALGTDTGGSTRLPAAYCGVVGLKPSYGLLSRWGVVSFADSLDCVGVLARDVEGARSVFDILNVYDERDPTAVLPETRARARAACKRRVDAIDWARGNLDGLRIGVPQEYFPSEISPSILEPVRRAIRGLKSRGAVVVPVSMPNTSYGLSAYYVLASAEASSCLARFDGIQYGSHVRPPPGTDVGSGGTRALYAHSRTAGFGREVRKRILLGTYALSADAFDNYFLQAQRVRQRVKEDFERVFQMGDEGVDVLIHASAIQTAPVLRGRGEEGLSGYVQDVLTVPASLAGVPGLSVPMGGDAGWPVGVSIVGPWGSEDLLFAVGRAVEVA